MDAKLIWQTLEDAHGSKLKYDIRLLSIRRYNDMVENRFLR
jgi:hypothetical protein